MIARSISSERTRKVLIIEDHDDTRVLYSRHFERAGYQVETAADGNEGIARALRMRPDVIVLDLRMPQLDGWDTIKILRTYPTTKSIPVIAVTAIVNADGLAQAMAKGCNAIVMKPCFPGDLEKTVDDVLGIDQPDSNQA